MTGLLGLQSALFHRDRTAGLASETVSAAFGWAERLRKPTPAACSTPARVVRCEVLAFATALVRDCLQESGFSRGAIEQVVSEIRAEAVRRESELATGEPRPGQGLLADSAGSEAWDSRVAHYTGGGTSGLPFTHAMFEEFSAATGLASTALVGRGCNLAALVFYLIMFGLLGGGPNAGFGANRRLLRETRECARQLGRLAARFGECEPQTPAGPGDPPPQSLTIEG